MSQMCKCKKNNCNAIIWQIKEHYTLERGRNNFKPKRDWDKVLKRRVSIDKDGKIPNCELKTKIKEGIKSAIRQYTPHCTMKPTNILSK